VYDVVRKGIHVTKRDLFYTDVKLFVDQKESDVVLEDVAATLGATVAPLDFSAVHCAAARPRFADLVDKLQARTPPDQDPLLANHSPADRRLPLAGSAFHRGWIARVHGDERKWEKEWETFLSQWVDADMQEGK
jgi:hypothetical protein